MFYMGINSTGTNVIATKSDSTSFSTTNNNSTMRSDQHINPYSANILLTHQQIDHCLQQSNSHVQQMSNIRVTLEDKDLWMRFYNVTNEMILTKVGRRTFPLIRVRIHGLEDNELYTVQIRFAPADDYKYRFLNGEWKTSPKNEAFNKQQSQQVPLVHQHPDSPNFGMHWMKEIVAFSKLKLTNNENSKNADSVYLKSLNKYQPFLLIFKHDKKNVDDKRLVYSKEFVETQFIAVTAYQNENITGLKIKHNPFAKAFLNNKPTITIDSERKVIISDTSSSNVKPEPKLIQNHHQPNFSPILPPTATQSIPQNSSHNWHSYYPLAAAAVAAKRPVYPPQPVANNIYHHQHQSYPYNDPTAAYTAAYNHSYNRLFPAAAPNPYMYQPFDSSYNTHHLQPNNAFFPDYSVTTTISEEQDLLKRKDRECDERPAKRSMPLNLVPQLDISPVYSTNLPNVDLVNDQQSEDDSLTSAGDNFTSANSDTLHQSANSSSSFTMSSTSIISS